MKKLFITILGACIGFILSFLLIGYLKLEGKIGIVVMVLGLLFGGSIASNIAGKSYKEEEKAVSKDKSFKVVIIWLFWVIVLIG